MFLVYCCWCGVWVDSTNNSHSEENWFPLTFLLAGSEKSFYWLFFQSHSYSMLTREWTKKSPLNSAFCCLQNYPEVWLRCWEQSDFHICCRVRWGLSLPWGHPVERLTAGKGTRGELPLSGQEYLTIWDMAWPCSSSQDISFKRRKSWYASLAMG